MNHQPDHPANVPADAVLSPMTWRGDHLQMIDQTRLPSEEVWLELRTAGEVREAIQSLRVRGAPAIGIAAAYGLYLGVWDYPAENRQDLIRHLQHVSGQLASSRPTAVNLTWALNRSLENVKNHESKDPSVLKQVVLDYAQKLHEEDMRICVDIGYAGQPLVPQEAGVITHCNTGSLATGRYGTALSVIYHAHLEGKNIHVWVDETRPLLQGSRLTAWELGRTGIPYHLITDSMAGWVMKTKRADLVIVGTDRVAANGDTANKIGTYALSILAEYHSVPFYVAAPLSSIDLSIPDGDHIPIEERDPGEVRYTASCATAPEDAPVFNPAFDVTPHSLIRGFITEKGIVRPDFSKNLSRLLSD